MSDEDLASIFTTPEVPSEPTPAVEPEPTPAVVEPEPEPVVKSKKSTNLRSTLSGVVSLNALKTARNTKNSASVALIQERLIELGFTDAGSDVRGHLSEGTVLALAKFDGSDLDTFLVGEQVVRKLFENTAVEITN